MITVCSHLQQLKYAQVCQHLSAVSDMELMDVIANVQGTVIVSMSLY